MRQKSISFVLPMYNERENIAETVGKASAIARGISEDYEIIVVDDASTDGSGDIVDQIAAGDTHVRPIKLKVNTKFGGALKEGLKSAVKDIVIYTDSDFPAKEADIKRAIELLDDAEIVTAYSLVIKDASLKRILMSKTYNFLVKALFGIKIRDINSGLKIYRKKVFEGMRLKSKSPFIDVEIFIEAARRGFRIKQYGLVFDLRTGGRSTISRPGVVLQTFLDMFAYKITPHLPVRRGREEEGAV